MILRYWYLFLGLFIVLVSWFIGKSDDDGFSGSPSVPAGLPKPKEHYVQMAKNLYNAMEGNGTNIPIIERVFNSITGVELVYIHKLYKKAYKRTLSTDLNNELETWFFFGNQDTIKLVQEKYKSAGLQY